MNILQNILTGGMNNEELDGKRAWEWRDGRENKSAAPVCDVMMKSVTLYADLKTYIEKHPPPPPLLGF